MVGVLQYRHNNGYDTVLYVRYGAALTRTTVTPKVFDEFAAGGFDVEDWGGQDVEDIDEPGDYGNLLAIYEAGRLRVLDTARWKKRVEFFGGRRTPTSNRL